MRMTAAVLYDVNKPYSIETVELDPPRRGEVLIKVAAAGVCRSDLHFQKGEATIALPAVLGHEGSGTVAAVGEGVSMVKPGDRVILSFVPNCGHCHFCESGHPHLCDEHARTTGKLFDGTSRLHTQSGQDCTHMGKVACFAEYAVVPEVGCILAPPSLDFPQMALIGCSVTLIDPNKQDGLPAGLIEASANSPNHDKDGQNILFGDGHVDWSSTAFAGRGQDNIYTRKKSATDQTGACDPQHPFASPVDAGDNVLLPTQ